MSDDAMDLPYCTLTVAGIPILFVNIKSIVVREWIFDHIPTIYIKFVAGQEFFGGITLQEDDIIEVELGSKPPEKRDLPVKGYFKLKGHTFDKQQETTVHEITGILACTNFNHPHRFRSFANKPSSDVMKEIAGELNLKPSIRVETTDAQTWLQSGTAMDFLKHLNQHSFIADDDLLLSFTDRESNFVVTSIKTILSERPMRLRHWPEGYASDPEPNDAKPENRIFPFVGFTYKSLTSIHNMQGGYGLKEYKYDFGAFTSIVHDQIIGSIATLHAMKKELKGQANVIIDTEASPSGHAKIMVAPKLNMKHKADFSSATALVLVKPHPDYKLGKLVNVELEILNRGEKSDTDGIYGGHYIIGGIVHHHEHPNGARMYLVLMRGGFEKGVGMEDVDVTSAKEKG